MTTHRVAALSLALTTSACFHDAPGFYQLTAAADMADGTGSSTTGAPPASPTSGTGVESDSDTGNGATVDASTESGAETDSAGDAELRPPRILGVDVPASVHLAGPVDVLVEAEHATAVRATLDGVELQPFEDQGGGVWLGHAPVFGAVDNGDHVIEVSATHGPLADIWPPVSFSVKTPAPGGQAWALTGPSGTTRGAAMTAEGDLLEVGTVEAEGVMKPSIRKRARVNGAELWPEGTIVLDEREGSADAIAVAPDGHIWVALNVRTASKVWLPRIVQLDVDGHATGVEATTEAGATVRGLAADAAGVVAVGFQPSGLGDMDVVTWRVGHDGAAIFSAKAWDYVPPAAEPHFFDDLAYDVVLVDGVAWVVGASTGYHAANLLTARGFVVRVDLATGEALATMVAAPVGAWLNTMFLAAARHPTGAVVTGSESTLDGTWQQITIQAFDAAGVRTDYVSLSPASVAYGTGVGVNHHGLVVACGVVHDGGVLRGVVVGRGGEPGSNFDYLFPGDDPSACNGLALDAWDQAYPVGDRLLGGIRQARAARLHQ